MERIGNRIAFLCTGDEIVNGEILDTNAPHITRQLIEHNFIPGTRLIVSDDQTEMEAAIRYLLTDHPVLITLGGLGPTSDDRTRFAVGAALELPLVFDEASWSRIVAKFSQLGLEIPENNRQQCLFPTNAEIYPNSNGTASACCITKSKQLVFMLPGPPNECRSIFDQYVLPRLLKTPFQKTLHRRSWMLLGVSEGAIAKGLDALVDKTPCDIGYRVNYPYLEVKLQSTDLAALEALVPKLEAQIKERLISRDKKTASELFYDYLQSSKETFSINDQATQGRLASKLLWPKTYNHIFFNKKEADIKVTLDGLSAYWENQAAKFAHMQLTIKRNGNIIIDHEVKVPIRGSRTPEYAVELACEYLVKTLR